MKINKHVGSVDIKINTSRIDRNLKESQKLLNMQVVADCEPLIPIQQGALRESVLYPQGIEGGEIEYNTPYAHYQYEGELYLAINGSSWAKEHEKKYPAGKTLTHIEHPETTDHFFEEAKQQHKEEWIKLVRETVGKD